jgi:beta-glucosidase-like glycosyl hydrolase/CubicO group peptidase (beta-lactamase class C family)
MKRKLIFVAAKCFFSVIFVSFLMSCAVVAAKQNPKRDTPILLEEPRQEKTERTADWVEETLASMTLEERVGQLINVSVSGNYVNTHSKYFLDTVERQIINNHVGGFIIFGGDIFETAHLTNEMQRLAKVPLLIASDLERGAGNQFRSAIQFPHNMAFGATRSPELAYEYGRITAIEGRAAGVNQTYSPVVDVNNNAGNPIINIRSYGETPELVSVLATAFIRGCQENGLIATAKHFPGHGDTDVDSHSNLPVINADRERLEKVELPPFRSAIEAGVKSIMSAHISIPALDPGGYPATLSSAILTDLLRNDLRFEGFVVTDAMNMGGIVNDYSIVQSAINTIKAGSDIVLMPLDASLAMKGITTAVKRGEITEERINTSVRRILRAKQWLGLNANKFADVEKLNEIVSQPENETVALEVATRSITLVRNQSNIVPINPTTKQKILVLTVNADGETDAGTNFKTAIRSVFPAMSGASIDQRTNETEMTEVLQQAQEADIIICGMYVLVRARKDNIALNNRLAGYFRQLLNLKKPVVFVSFGSPYVLMQFPEIDTYLCTYSTVPVSQVAAANALFGQKPITGKLPVSIPGLHEFGEGIQILPIMISHFERPGRILVEIDPYRAGFTRDFNDRLSAVLQSGVDQQVAPAVVCVVGKSGGIVFNHAFGKMTYDSTASLVATDAIFDLASLSKVTATTTLAMILYDRNAYSFDDPVSKYIPEMKNGERMTIKNLLTHSSGLPAFKPFYRDYKGKEAILEQIFKTDLEYEPGTRTVYSDIGMMLMATILERITGKTLDVLARDEIFTPLEMNSTFYNPPAEFIDRIAPTENDPWRGRVVRGEVHDENAYAFGGVSGHAGVFSTGSDLAKLCQLLLNGGIYGDKRLIQASTVATFIARQNLVRGSSRALGWDTRSENSSSGAYFTPRAYGHTGFTGTSIWIDPERDLFVILLTNRVYPTRENQKIGAFRQKVHDTVVELLRK